MSGDVREVILARLAEVEAVARAATPGPWAVYRTAESVNVGADHGDYANVVKRFDPDAEEPNLHHIALNDPAAVLAWVAGIRAVVDLHGPPHDMSLLPDDYCGTCGRRQPCRTLRAIAAIWAPASEERGEVQP